MNPTNESIGRPFAWCRAYDNDGEPVEEINFGRDKPADWNEAWPCYSARELDRQAPGVYADCCDTPEYCSSVRRCTRQDEAAPQPAAQEQGECMRHECRRVRIEMQAEIDRLRAAGAEDARDSELLNAVETNRISLVPEYEGGWDAEVYFDEGKCVHMGGGQTARAAIASAVAAIASQAQEVER